MRFLISEEHKVVYNLTMKQPRDPALKRQWDDPAKRPASAETMNTPGDFRQFTETMRTMLKAKPEKKQ
jgi:hypothetical protein